MQLKLRFEKYEMKRYLHFDNRIDINKNKKVRSYVTNPSKIKVHGFFPLIHYVNITEKYDETVDRKEKRPIKKKPRHIMYASHIDNYIYKYYGETLNEYYNKWVETNDIDSCSIAYRYKENEKGKSNIDFAAEVINSIYQYKDCFIMIGDFEKFFDKIDHYLLKGNLAKVLGEKDLPDDWYNVFKSVTKYNYYNKKLLNKQLGSDRNIKRTGRLSYFRNTKQFRKFKKTYKSCKNNKNFGIPQGTAISAILANVYTIHFDKMVSSMIKKYKGLYRRYSDDFIIVLPRKAIDLAGFRKVERKVYEYITKHKLYIQEEKTELYCYSEGRIININNNKLDKIDYLGFLFDGKNVRMRGKSPYKFYRNAYKVIKKAKKVKSKRNLQKIPYRRQLYRLYTDMGIDRKPYGNFITYAMKSQKVFDNISTYTENLMLQQIKNRKKKIEKKLGVKFSFRTQHL